MKRITQEQAAAILEQAAHLEPTIHTTDRFITFGINASGKEFVLISYGFNGEIALGMM